MTEATPNGRSAAEQRADNRRAFFDAVHRGHGAWDTAFREAVTVSIGFVVIALAGAIADVVRRASSAQAAASGEPVRPRRAARHQVPDMPVRSRRQRQQRRAGHAYAAKMERVLGIGGVFFRSADPAALARRYETNLGINVFPATDDWWMQQAGPTVSDEISEASYGRFGWATDPDGNRFELWQPAPDLSKEA